MKENGELVKINFGGQSIEVGAIKQFGQMNGTASIPLGYGRTQSGVCGTGIGTDVFHL
ncbi:MAG: hypothetical protein IPO85_10795 [Saprospiraceae bacterium]|uniref:Uncharacterized protein n=1 Tax=Candidatus Defluviibacterium haderslevense TaxID=2981993 RepID=A0A9D7SB36_9BACT|nr:hypothetical protein [Candidatus Defluviibacterium haderslevense]